MPASPRARRLRWLAPIAVLCGICLLALLPTLSSAATPDLAPISAQQLLTKVQQSNVQAFSGDFALTSNLGIPDLSAVQGSVQTTGFNPTDLLSGTHTASIAVDGPDRQRVSMPGSLSEVDAFHDGQNAWLWQSDGHTVTHYILPAETTDTAPGAEPTPDANAPEPTPTPDQLAKQLLDKITPSTGVSVTTPAYVADKAVYELVLAPHAADSTIDHIGIAVDASNGMPLQVTAVPKGQSDAALQLGFTKIDYGKPGGSFSFTPPPGSTVTTHDLTKPQQPDTTQPDVTRNGPVRPVYARRFRHRGFAKAVAPGGAAPSPGDEPMPMQVPAPGTVGAAVTPGPPSGPDTAVVGQDWTQVVIARALRLPLDGGAIREASTPVSGSWGSGRLLHTSLVNVLFLSDGRVAVGFVTPSALEAAVAHG
ncbi:MAG: hypothetical protein JO265_06715 [Acidimicrobiia bacterium]|nr:hypothetical protein [Acidimicrobiia bacterium]